MVRLYMIEFQYHQVTYYANVIEHQTSMRRVHINILSNKDYIPKNLILVYQNRHWELSRYSLPANEELVAAIAQKLGVKGKSEVA